MYKEAIYDNAIQFKMLSVDNDTPFCLVYTKSAKNYMSLNRNKMIRNVMIFNEKQQFRVVSADHDTACLYIETNVF